jgi:Holliday junction resolvase RusA-like endonuclease
MKFKIDELPPSTNQLKYHNSLKQNWIKRNLIKTNKKFSKPISLKMKIYTSNIRRDIDNFLKAIFDLLEKSNVIKNDNLIYKLEVEKIKSQSECIELEIRPYPLFTK